MSNARKRRIEGVRPSKSDRLSNLGLDVQRIMAEETVPQINIGNPEPAVGYSLKEAMSLHKKYSEVPVQDIAYVTANVDPLDWVDILEGSNMISLLANANQAKPAIESQVELYNIAKQNDLLSESELWVDMVSYLVLSSSGKDILKDNFLAIKEGDPWTVGGYASDPRSRAVVPSAARPDYEEVEVSDLPTIDIPGEVLFDQSNNYDSTDQETGIEKGDILNSSALFEIGVRTFEERRVN